MTGIQREPLLPKNGTAQITSAPERADVMVLIARGEAQRT
ncbi:hypothetical protein M728_000938 [Ensifer sp. WSM1721]